MAAFETFEANTGATAGKTITIQTSAAGSSIAGVLDTTNIPAPHVLISNAGANWVWCRMSAEATPTASQADIPLAPNSVRLFTNPVSGGKTGIAVVISVSTSQFVYFTPGNGGVS